MNRNSLRPMYPALTGEERFRLVVQAGASGDHREAIHLTQSCPRVEGTAVDPFLRRPGQGQPPVGQAVASGAAV